MPNPVVLADLDKHRQTPYNFDPPPETLGKFFPNEIVLPYEGIDLRQQRLSWSVVAGRMTARLGDFTYPHARRKYVERSTSSAR